jgi:hypothetical protein
MSKPESEPEFTGRQLVAWLEEQGYEIEEAALRDEVELGDSVAALYTVLIRGVTDHIGLAVRANRVITVGVVHPNPSVGSESIDMHCLLRPIGAVCPAPPNDPGDPSSGARTVWEALQELVTEELDTQRGAKELVASTVADLKRVFQHLPAHTSANALGSVALGIYRHLEALAKDWNPEAATSSREPANGQDGGPQA